MRPHLCCNVMMGLSQIVVIWDCCPQPLTGNLQLPTDSSLLPIDNCLFRPQVDDDLDGAEIEDEEDYAAAFVSQFRTISHYPS